MSIFDEPATPFLLFTYFDILLVLILIFINIFLYKTNLVRKIDWKLKLLLFIILFIVIPIISVNKEVSNVYKKFITVDEFNLLYIYLKFPIWWLIACIQILIIKSILVLKIKNYT